MATSDLFVLRAGDIARVLEGREEAVMGAVAAAYASHRAGRTVLPHSSFLHMAAVDPGPERIIALPALINDEQPIAGLKWIASFPRNWERGMARASAVLVVNSVETGRPTAVLESSLISSHRTAASAALAARALHGASETRAGIIGCGLINADIARYLRVVMPGLRQLILYDIVRANAEAFARRMSEALPGVECLIVDGAGPVFERARLVSFATVASTPHVLSTAGWSADTTILHVSLRDLAPSCIQMADNVVDDIDHVLRAKTSLHLAEQDAGHRGFIRCTLADVLAGAAPPRDGQRPVVFSPFGLGILDLAVARLVLAAGEGGGPGVRVSNFLPDDGSPAVGSANQLAKRKGEWR